MLVGTSCKKSKPAPGPTVLEQKLLGKWTWVKYEDYHVPADPANDFVFNNPQGAYMEFLGVNSSSNLLYNEQGLGAIAYTWTPIDDNTFIGGFSIPPLTLTITTSTATSLVFSNTTTANGVQHIVRITLTKP